MSSTDSPTLQSKNTLVERTKLVLLTICALVFVAMGLYAWSFINSLAVASRGKTAPGLLMTKPKELLVDGFYVTSFIFHVFFGGIAIATGWTNFVHSWRLARPALHRWTGRIYALSIFISAPAGFSVAAHATGGAVSTSGFSGLSLLWLSSTVWAVAAIRGRPRQLMAHRKAMILSYALTLSAITQRIVLGIVIAATRGDFALAMQISSWLCWLPHLVPVYLLWRRIDRDNAADKQTRIVAQPADVVEATSSEIESGREPNEKQ